MPDNSVPFLNDCGGNVIGTRMMLDQTWLAPRIFQNGWLFCRIL